MCTIIGWNGKVSTPILRHLIGMSHEYGPHSTGVAYTDRAGRARVFKKAKHPFDFLRDHNGTVKSAAESELGLAHTRYASVGSVNEANAHPFIHAGLIFAHNGTIKNWRDLDENLSSDSQALGPLLHAQETWKASGTAGLVWMHEGKLFAFRRSKPLVAVTFYREEPVTLVATYNFLIPSWLWEFEHKVHVLREFVAYEVSLDGVEKVWEEP